MGLDVILPVYGLALLDTMSPATIGISIYLLLTAGARTPRLLFSYLATVALFYFGLGTALMTGLGALVDSLGDAVNGRTAYLIQAGIGAALFVGAWFVPTKKKDAGDGAGEGGGGGRRERRAGRAQTVPAMVGLGVTTGLLEAATALPYLAAIGLMTSNELSPAQWAPLLAGYNLIMVLPGVLLFLVWRVAGERVRARFERFRDWLQANSAETLGWIMGIAGVLLVRDAVYVLNTEFQLFG
ncbi:GAP family protein [Jiangella alkaliphila]|uniref:Cytochrome c biogenesis protein CcdA n=1 Tax=Jiangella alkaliphila TaxID=419479 RepID=A0A1H2GK83_9ACTN|nr:GAP family protein [Jiangella alkaliphila]SDU20027.1 Cytochrome c biogenesis protein CcdA [Jiangella alkaliphila]